MDRMEAPHVGAVEDAVGPIEQEISDNELDRNLPAILWNLALVLEQLLVLEPVPALVLALEVAVVAEPRRHRHNPQLRLQASTMRCVRINQCRCGLSCHENLVHRRPMLEP